jgi:hypothetical protein
MIELTPCRIALSGRALVHEVGEEVPNPQDNDYVAELATLTDELVHATQQATAGEAERMP